MDKVDIIKIIELFAPLDLQEEWDCSGAIVSTSKNQVNKIMLALTVTDDVYLQAKQSGCDMIISHHPLFCVPIKYSDIDIYCAHTNADKTLTTDQLIKKTGFNDFEKYGEFVRIVKLNNPIEIDELISRLRKISPHLRYVNNKNKKQISSIGFCAGSGSEFITELKVDAFVTGDIKFHTAVDSNIILFDIGHFESEIFILEVFKNLIEKASDVKIIMAKEKSPFIY